MNRQGAGMTHAELINRAGKWLARSRRCPVVFTETGCFTLFERPDAIAWTTRGVSILVECKASVNDFYADRRKPSRIAPALLGIGQERWYMAEAGLLTGRPLPEGWGLLEVHPKQVRRYPPNEWLPLTVAQAQREMRLLVAKLGLMLYHERTREATP